MQFLYTSFLSQQKTKTGQPTRKETKVLPQKSTKKTLHPAKEAPKAPRALTEEEKIIQAAEKYHQQLSGKKTDQVAGQTKVATPVDQRKTEKPAPAAKQNVVNLVGRPKVEKVTDKKSRSSAKTTVVAWTDQQSSTEGPNPNANIYTGNPGMYQAEEDTLNFWSLTPVPLDTLTRKVTIAEMPARPYGYVGKPMKTMGQDWTFFLILIGWTIFASLRFGFSKYIVQVFQSIFNFSIATRLYREQGYSNNFGLFRLNLIFFLFLPFPIYLIAKDNGVSVGGFGSIELYLIVLAVVNGYFMLKILLYKILGSIFSQKETTGELVFNMMLYHNVLGLIMLTIATFHALIPNFGIVSLFLVPGLIAIFYLLSIVRSIYFAIRQGVSIFYLILYLCALEILPILLVAKLATGQ